MENWKNLNKMLTLERKESTRQDSLVKQLIDFCSKGEKKEIKRILMEGAPLNCYDEHLTPLIVCIQNDNFELANYFLRAGATTSYRPLASFQDAFWYALKNKKHDFLRLFVSNRCLLQWDLQEKQPALVYATLQSDLPAVEILLSHYAIKVNERDGSGNTALHHNMCKSPMTQEDMEIGRLLIAAGADTALPNFDGHTPEELAQEMQARAVLTSGKLERELPVNEDAPKEAPANTKMTKKGKLKI